MSHNPSLKKIKKQIYTSLLTRQKFTGISNTCYSNMPLFQTLQTILNFKKRHWTEYWKIKILHLLSDFG